MKKAMILSGRGRYADKWHDYAATSHAIAVALSELGMRVVINSIAVEALTTLGDVDLLVVNAGSGAANEDLDGTDDELALARAGLDSYLDRGGPVAAFHTALSSLWDNPRWSLMLGATWVAGRSYHPDGGPCTIEVRSDAHPIVTGLRDFDTVDEQYCALATSMELDAYLTYTHDGTVEPLAWAHTAGGSRLVYDSLGHSVDGYGPGRLALLRREVEWLLGE